MVLSAVPSANPAVVSFVAEVGAASAGLLAVGCAIALA